MNEPPIRLRVALLEDGWHWWATATSDERAPVFSGPADDAGDAKAKAERQVAAWPHMIAGARRV